VTEPQLSIIPVEARPYQGVAAGVATRLLAGMIDTLVVAGSMLAGYAGYLAVRFVISPRKFQVPDASLLLSGSAFLGVAIVYLTASWWISGRTVGNHVMGVRVVAGGRSLRPTRAFVRAVFCAVFPVGLFWCAVSPRGRSVQDLVLRTTVVYDWRPRATNRGPRP